MVFLLTFIMYFSLSPGPSALGLFCLFGALPRDPGFEMLELVPNGWAVASSSSVLCKSTRSGRLLGAGVGVLGKLNGNHTLITNSWCLYIHTYFCVCIFIFFFLYVILVFYFFSVLLVILLLEIYLYFFFSYEEHTTVF